MKYELLDTLYRLWKHPHGSRDALISFQNRKLRRLIHHAYHRVPFYRRLFDENGISPEQIRTAADLVRLPITDKNDIRAVALTNILDKAVKPDRLVKRITSGASGQPFFVRRSSMEDHIINMFRVRSLRLLGKRYSDRSASLVAFIPGENRTGRLTRLRQAAGVNWSRIVNCLQPTEVICNELEALDPDVIGGYAGAVAHIANRARGRFADKKLRLVFCGGEALTPTKRSAIENGFGVDVYDVYGAHECNLAAWECPHGYGYHVCDDNIVAEVVRDGRPVREGEKGELIITALHCYAMPFIRYRLGDRVVKGRETCACGQPFSTFERLEGRLREYLLLPDGRRVHPLEVILPVITANKPWMDQYQMIQETGTRFVLRVSILQKPIDADLASMSKMVTARLGAGAEFRIELVDHIPFEASGKFKDSRCLI